MTLTTIYGRPVKNLSTARIVSSEEAKRLVDLQRKEDIIRMRYGFEPLIKEEDFL